jgi:hypothetical protein
MSAGYAREKRVVSASNSATIAGVSVARVSAIAERKSSVVERPLGGFPRGPLDVGRSEERACLDEDRDVDGLVGDLAHVARPDGGARLVVRRPDGKHVVESPRP